MPRSLPTLLLLLAATPALAQTALYSNGSTNPTDPAFSTGALTASGVPAPLGATWSEVQSAGDAGANAIAGFSGHYTVTTGAFRFADDFTVPASGYRLTRAAFFVYQTGAPAMTNPVSAINLRIWNGPPTSPASAVIFGDTSTDRLIAAAPTDIYRVFSTTAAPLAGPPDTARHIWRIEADLGALDLPAGDYWLDWQLTSADPDVELFTPPITLPGTRALNSWNALHLKAAATTPTTWLPLVDPGKPTIVADLPQDLPFILLGDLPCPADWNNDTTINSGDVSAFITAWLTSIQSGTLTADFNHDLVVNSTDLTAFLTAWLDAIQNGC